MRSGAHALALRMRVPQMGPLAAVRGRGGLWGRRQVLWVVVICGFRSFGAVSVAWFAIDTNVKYDIYIYI